MHSLCKALNEIVRPFAFNSVVKDGPEMKCLPPSDLQRNDIVLKYWIDIRGFLAPDYNEGRKIDYQNRVNNRCCTEIDTKLLLNKATPEGGATMFFFFFLAVFVYTHESLRSLLMLHTL